MSLHVAAAFFRRGVQEALSYRVAFALQLLLAVVSLLAFYYLARFVDSGSPAGTSTKRQRTLAVSYPPTGLPKRLPLCSAVR